MKIKRKILSGEKGASAVEFAIILPILIILIFAIVQFGIAFNKYIAVTHAVREGARLAAVGLYEDPDFDFEQAVRDSAPTIDIDTITVENPDGMAIGNPVVVTVTVETFFINIPLGGSWGPFQLESQATMRREQ